MAKKVPVKLVGLTMTALAISGGIALNVAHRQARATTFVEDKREAVEINWKTLRDVNLETKQSKDGRITLDMRNVRIPGFVIPLEDDNPTVQEFLLVPWQMVCIHSPTPPPNQMIHVTLSEPLAMDEVNGLTWVEGTLRIQPHVGTYGKAEFVMLARRVKPVNREE